jgi:hypothetical protein
MYKSAHVNVLQLEVKPKKIECPVPFWYFTVVHEKMAKTLKILEYLSIFQITIF